MPDDEYEILPHAEIEHLRSEVEQIKKNPLGDTRASVTLLQSLAQLNENIAKLNAVFASANEEMLRAYNDQSMVEQLRKIREENAKIAHGIVALADLIKEGQKARERMQAAENAPLPRTPQIPIPTRTPVPAQPSELSFHEDALVNDMDSSLQRQSANMDIPLSAPQNFGLDDEVPPPPPR